MTIYRAKYSYIFTNSLIFILPLLLTIVTLTEGSAATSNEWIGLCGFWVIVVIITFIPLAFKLEVNDDFVKSYLFGFLMITLTSSNVKSVTYRNLFKGGLGFGKALIMYADVNGRRKRFSMGERLYGKEAINHVKNVLKVG